MIKIQHNTTSAGRWGGVQSFIKIMHEEVIVLRNFRKLTWQELVLRTLRELGGEASLMELYTAIAKHPKQLSNPTYQATVRRTLQESAAHAGKGLWKWLPQQDNTPQ